ncbi:peptidylprolyl isomerase [Arenibacterium sp. LLYu02]|uniref:peptidylprolyl isomerase n=1 Tax=Arenibacterium sp. LLYu02 TaxID=3404132 RepID=UPI003B219991
MQQNVKTSRPRPTLFPTTLRRAALGLCAALICSTAPIAPAVAQGLFSPAITVNEDVITYYELEQRALFLSLFGTVKGDPLDAARDDLIDDKLKMAALKEVGLTLSEEEVTEGMRELAGRANLELDEFLARLKEAGVAPETVRDFSTAGLGWREYIRGRYLSVARPTDEEIDRAMGTAGAGGVQVLLSEIVMPVDQQTAAQVQDLATQISALQSSDAFAASAAQFSAAESRVDGGRLPWLPLSNLPGPLQEVILDMEPGEITQPIPMQGAIAVFQMRGLREVEGSSIAYAAIDYATYRIPGGRSPEALARAKTLRDSIDTCDDLYGVAKDQDPAILTRTSLPPRDIPQDIALELVKLDPNESSANVTRDDGQTLLFVMLCGRTSEVAAAQEDARLAVANALVQQRLNDLAESRIEQMRSNARIVEK